ncbi:Extended synaptotagmin-1 [Frankliniella fusca]|uniref:Extended synaptotagmin-1 n=1 Tax=Frankliniella fusca TaxID=407009 RepID=A0AAE1L6Q3_9NEOP|nr:Extended synaptotagmin-1 [Frankliniella fusca]
MKTCVILFAVVAACAAMPHPGPPAPPGPMPPTPHAMPAPGPPGKQASDLKGEEALYLASPYSALPYQPYSAYNIRGLGLNYGYGAIGGLGYSSYGLQTALPSQPIYYY